MTSAESRSQRAEEILNRWEESRQPFILYLRDFKVTMRHGQGFLLENHLSVQHSLAVDKVGVLTIVDQNEVPLPGASGHGAPALVLPHDKWQEVVADLIGKASMIVSEVPVLGPGAAFELQTCIEKKKAGSTVLIIPAPGGPFSLLDDHPVIRHFPRVIWYDEIPELSAAKLFVFDDLMERAKAIAQVNPEERRALTDEGGLIAKFPIKFGGLVTGYQALAVRYEQMGDLTRASRNYFRALVAAAASEDKAAIVDISLRMVQLQLVVKNFDLATNYLNGAMKIALELGDASRISRLHGVQLDLMRLQSASRLPAIPQISEYFRQDRSQSVFPNDRNPGDDSNSAWLAAMSDSVEPVFLGAAVLERVCPGDRFNARFVAYIEAERERVKGLLNQLSPDSKVILDTQSCHWPAKAKVTVRLEAPGLTIANAEKVFEWSGRFNLVDFQVEVPADARETRTFLRFWATVEGSQAIYELAVDIHVGAKPSESGAKWSFPENKTFVSYAHEDRDLVRTCLTAVQVTSALRLHVDFKDLEPNVEWKQDLERLILDCDKFLLFWCCHARASKWVTWELEVAQRAKGPKAITICPLQQPTEVPPPVGFEHIHVDSAFLQGGNAHKNIP